MTYIDARNPGPEYHTLTEEEAAAMGIDTSPMPAAITQEDIEGLRILAKRLDDDADNFEPTSPAARFLTDLASRLAAVFPGAARPQEEDQHET